MFNSHNSRHFKHNHLLLKILFSKPYLRVQIYKLLLQQKVHLQI